ncbi:FAD-dependent oxidoreductase [Ilumatobacter sp.]|uniref:FAD-dependent oxidoreductase n=1 Tax=Ilumatobacter sp. TaxID=1967498 RepID=UPI003C379032
MSINNDHTIAVIGAGSAGEALVRELEHSEESIVMFEPEYVGGECPFLACMPSKSMLHDRTRRSWNDAVERRDEIVAHLDDSAHADAARELGATLVRSRARITDHGAVEADGTVYAVDHIVIATGAEPVHPDIDGLDPGHDRVWTSRDVLTAEHRPESVVIVGGGVIGSELAFMFAGFDTSVTTLDTVDRPANDLHPKVSGLIAATLDRAGVRSLFGVEIERIELTDTAATVHLRDGSSHTADRVVIAVGRTPRRSGLGLESLGLNPDDLTVSESGRVDGADSVWVIGDAAGEGQYTHVANHQAAVVADHLAGQGRRTFDDVVIPACMFIDPPLMIVGPTWNDLRDDPDVVWAKIDVDPPRSSTDEHGPGFLAVAARRSTGCIVAAHGIGPRFDELAYALVIAIDGSVPVRRLVQTIQPFPTVGEVLGEAFDALAERLDYPPAS